MSSNGWYVLRLLKDFHTIKEQENISSELYDDLLSVEIAISKLDLKGKDLKLVDMIKDGKDHSDMAKVLHWSRHKVVDREKAILNRLAFILGDLFTNDGYASFICDKYKKDDYQKISVKTFLDGDYD